jgi:hypothetical protein
VWARGPEDGERDGLSAQASTLLPQLEPESLARSPDGASSVEMRHMFNEGGVDVLLTEHDGVARRFPAGGINRRLPAFQLVC